MSSGRIFEWLSRFGYVVKTWAQAAMFFAIGLAALEIASKWGRLPF